MQTEGAVLSKAVQERASLRKPLESVAASASVAAPQTNLDSAKAAKNSLSGIVSVYYPSQPGTGFILMASHSCLCC